MNKTWRRRQLNSGFSIRKIRSDISSTLCLMISKVVAPVMSIHVTVHSLEQRILFIFPSAHSPVFILVRR
jgi:hypothetical protein